MFADTQTILLKIHFPFFQRVVDPVIPQIYPGPQAGLLVANERFRLGFPTKNEQKILVVTGILVGGVGSKGLYQKYDP